jgi:hypothetical protein
VKNNGTATALAGMRARAAFADGSVSFGYANALGPAAALTESIAAADAVFDGLIDNNQLFVDTRATDSCGSSGMVFANRNDNVPMTSRMFSITLLGPGNRDRLAG